MTKALVVDASAMITFLRSEPDADAVSEILTARKRAGGSLLVPAGFWLEVVNSLVRRHRLSSAEVLEAFVEIDSFGIQTVEIDRPLVVMVLDLAERFGLTGYDASYLALAIAERAELLTLDGDLAVASGDRAVAIGGPPRLHETPAVYEHDVTWPRYKEASAYLAKLRAEALAARSG
jgi:predicted nucleic acid-binding protein